MFNLNFFKQKSPKQRFLLILGASMILIFLSLSVLIVFFNEALHIDEGKFPRNYRIAFAVLLIVYAGIRFSRLINQKDSE